jgi:hypothetical protein
MKKKKKKKKKIFKYTFIFVETFHIINHTSEMLYLLIIFKIYHMAIMPFFESKNPIFE